MLNKNLISFGEQLRSLRTALHLSLRDVAKEIGMDTSLLGKLERNERRPTKSQLRILSTFFNIDYNQLLSQAVSDQIAWRLINENINPDILQMAERKIQILKTEKIKYVIK